MKQFKLTFVLTVLMSMVGAKAFAVLTHLLRLKWVVCTIFWILPMDRLR